MAHWRHAVIEDYVVGSTYEIISVNGELPNRRKHGIFVTIVPLVLVSKGRHEVLVRERNDRFGEDVNPKYKDYKLNINVEANKTYRIVENNGKPSLILVER